VSGVSRMPAGRRSAREWLVAANTTRNVATWDRWIRAALPFVVAGLWLAGVVPTWGAIPLGVVAAMLLPTAATGACSVYYALGVSTLPDGDEPAR
jgi:hypothetical protein